MNKTKQANFYYFFRIFWPNNFFSSRFCEASSKIMLIKKFQNKSFLSRFETFFLRNDFSSHTNPIFFLNNYILEFFSSYLSVFTAYQVKYFFEEKKEFSEVGTTFFGILMQNATKKNLCHERLHFIIRSFFFSLAIIYMPS